MAGVYHLTEKELRFLSMFVEIQGFYGFGEVDVLETKTEAEECADALCKKGYLYRNEQNEYEIDSTLELILKVAEHPYGYLFMDNLRKEEVSSQTAIYFLDDVIGMIEKVDFTYELYWLPFLPLAIGEVANLHTPFLNDNMAGCREPSTADVGQNMDDYLKAGFGWQWEMWGKQLEDEEKSCNIFVLADGNEQIMIRESDENVTILKPDKETYVNTITEWLAFLHGKAIGKKLQEA